MPSPPPRGLVTADEVAHLPAALRDHRTTLCVRPPARPLAPAAWHRAKYQPGLATALLDLAGTASVGDPFAGTGRFFEETQVAGGAANDLDPRCADAIRALGVPGLEVTNLPADRTPWHRDALIFSPPYYPRTDRCQPNAHDDGKRGPVVGFRDSYGCSDPAFVGNPAGVEGIYRYREAMRAVYAHLRACGTRMVVVTKNWVRKGVELRLDWDTILMAEAAGWHPVRRTGWEPPQSLWSKFNQARGGMVTVEDVLIFD